MKSKAITFAMLGNDLSHLGLFDKAIEQFSEAIRVDPGDFRFYGNRSYCYDKLGLYEE